MVGQKLGRYQIVRLLGKGGMGQVYEAYDAEIERRAAIKVLHAQFFDNAEVAQRFQNEARAVNIIGHPSLVNAFEFGRTPDGCPYIVMEYLEGETLRQRLRRVGRLGADAVRIARQITSALCAAHAKKIVHRDLKPSNIMLVADPDMVGGERVKVLDFGIAKLAGPQRLEQVDTRTGAILGSPGYMSPEQCRNVTAVDDRSDVYSLGVILYEMLLGRPPFVAESDAEVMAMHMYSEPPLLNAIDGRIRPELSAFVHRMLHKKPGERPSSNEVISFLNVESGFAANSYAQWSGMETLPIRPPPETGSENALPNTLSRASGQGNHRKTRRTSAIAVLCVGLLCATGIWAFRLRAKRPAAPKPPSLTALAPVVTVHWMLKSTPPNSEVFRESDKRILGHTPFDYAQPRSAGKETLVLRHPGYIALPIALDRDASGELALTLMPVPVPSPEIPKPVEAAEKVPAHRKPVTAKTVDKRRPTQKVTNADIELIK